MTIKTKTNCYSQNKTIKYIKLQFKKYEKKEITSKIWYEETRKRI